MYICHTIEINMNYKPLRNELLVVVDKEDKYSHTIEGTDIKLFIDKDFGWNEREKNAVNATVHHPGVSSLKEGTRIVCWHNCFGDHNLVDTITTNEDSVYGGHKKLYVYKVNQKHVFFYFDEDGEPTPMPGFLLVDRIYKRAKTSEIILTELNDEKEQNHVVVSKVANISNENVEEQYIKPNDIIIIETMADYEVVYSDKGREHRIIRVKEEEVIAVDHGYEITENHKRGI
jgi:co-chaperonin GroES (HSP10)